MSSYYPISAIINLFTSLGLGILFISKKSRFRQFSYYNLAIALWSCFYVGWQYAGSRESAIWLIELLMVGATLIPRFYFLSVAEIVDADASQFKWIKRINTFCVLIFIPLMFTRWMIHSVSVKLDFPYWPNAGKLFPLFLLYFFINVLLGYYLLYKKYRATKSNRYLFMFVTTLIAFTGGSTNYFLWLDIPIPPVGNILVGIYAVLVAVAITKLNLLDISLIITRNVAWVIGTAAISGGYLLFIAMDSFATGTDFPSRVIAPTLGYLILSAWLLPKIRLWIQTEAKKKFLKGTYDYREVLTKFTNRFSRCASISEVVTALEIHLTQDIEIRWSSFLIPEGFDEKKELSGPYIPADTHSDIRLTETNALIQIIGAKSEIIYASHSPEITKILETIGCAAVVPCMHNDQLMAILLLGEKMVHNRFTPDDKSLLPLLGTQIGIVLNRLRKTRFEAEINIAQRIQSEVLPRNPSIPNLELACLMVPATEMGGDYYDIIHTPTGTWILLGDVTGHGVGSAMVMFMVQSIITTLVKSNSASTPSELLYNANRILCQNMQRLDEGRPLTIVALYTVDGHQFSYCGSHESLMILRHDQPNVEMVEIDQFPFGIGMIEEMSLAEFGEGTLSLAPGDILFIGTDGITEAAKNGKYSNGTFGEAGLADCLISHRTQPLTEFSDALITQLKQYTNNTFHDDITFIAARSV